MLVVEIDMIPLQTFQAGLAGAFYVFGATVNGTFIASRLSLNSEFCGEKNFAAIPRIRGERSADQLFIVSRAVHIGGIKEVDAFIQGVVKRLH